MAKKNPLVKVRVSTATCTLYASSPMACPLCNVVVPANTLHTCERKE